MYGEWAGHRECSLAGPTTVDTICSDERVCRSFVGVRRSGVVAGRWGCVEAMSLSLHMLGVWVCGCVSV